jgi:signal transduction histidine kinase
LNAIIGFSAMFTQRAFGPVGAPEYETYANDIHDSGKHLLDLINDLLDMSKIEANQMSLTDETIDVPTAVDAALRLFSDRAGGSGIDVKTRFEDDLPPLTADGRILRQILVNLISNSLKFTPDGGRITVSAGRSPGGGMSVSVADTGIGIPADELDKVTNPFHQVDRGRSRRYEGTGLGLSLVERFAKMHGGSLSIDSIVDEGTTVTVVFPPERVGAGAPEAIEA